MSQNSRLRLSRRTCIACSREPSPFRDTQHRVLALPVHRARTSAARMESKTTLAVVSRRFFLRRVTTNLDTGTRSEEETIDLFRRRGDVGSASRLSAPAFTMERASRVTAWPVELVTCGVGTDAGSVSGWPQKVRTEQVSWRFLDQLVSSRSPGALGTQGPAAHHMFSTGLTVPTPSVFHVLLKRTAGSQLAGPAALVVASFSLGSGTVFLMFLPSSRRGRAKSVATTSSLRLVGAA